MYNRGGSTNTAKLINYYCIVWKLSTVAMATLSCCTMLSFICPENSPTAKIFSLILFYAYTGKIKTQ